MAVQDATIEEKVRKLLYINSFHGSFIAGDPDPYYNRLVTDPIFQWVKTSPDEFLKLVSSANDDPLLTRRSNIFYLTGKALNDKDLPNETKLNIKKAVEKLIRSEEDFFDFIKYFTIATGKSTGRISTSVKKMIVNFYKRKEPMEFAKCVTKQGKYHGWSHKDLLALSHFKADNVLFQPTIKYVLFGINQVPEANEDNRSIIEYLGKSQELRSTQDVAKAVALIKELRAGVRQVNSKLYKKEEIWLAALANMTTREILQSLYKFFKMGFLKSGNNQFQTKVIEALTNPEKVKQCNLHPVEVFMYLKFFERGGKIPDTKLIEYLHKKDIQEETLKKITTPIEPKCKGISQNISKCLQLSYENIQPSGKKFLVTIDVTEKSNDTCFRNKRISFLEASVAFIRFLSKVEKNVTVAVFKDSQVNFVDVSKYHAAVEKLQEHKATYVLPTAPLEWARNKKKPIDVFINFMSCDWYACVPQEVREKLEKLSECLSKYSKKMKAPDTKVIKIFLNGVNGVSSDNGRNILSIAGFTPEVPRVIEGFCKGRFV